MRSSNRQDFRWLCTFVVFITMLAAVAFGQQMADPNFDANVAKPAYTKKHPKVLFDEAHDNFHTVAGRYKPFVDLLTNDGYAITANKEKFQAKTLAGYDILLIANATGPDPNSQVGESAFSDEECDVVQTWVKGGGSLLLIADHAPFGGAAEKLALRFEINMSKGHTGDPNNHDPLTNSMTFLVYTRENKLLGDHAVTKGRNATERINNVLTFTGQSLKGPAGSVAFLKVSDTAFDRLPKGAPVPAGVTVTETPNGPTVSAAGRAQGIALKYGKGRVVVLGEAAMMSAQVVKFGDRPDLIMGMNRSGIDNRQLALNIMHWLSHLL